MWRFLGLVLAASLALSGAACSGCATALLEGVLVNDGSGGMAIKAPEGAVVPVKWPGEIHVSMDAGRLVLANPLGFVVAREGEFVRVGGGMFDDVRFGACGPIAVAPSSPPAQ